MSTNISAEPPRTLIVMILVLASSVSIMSTDLYTPSLPDLTRYFSTSDAMVKLTISLNLLAFALAQLIHGPLSDRFGRRPVLLISLLSVALFSVACAVAGSITELIIARVLLGIAAGAEAVIGLAILKDLYDEKSQMRALALLNMVIAVTPAIAPILGGYLHVHFGWQSNFFLISALAVITLLVILIFLPESTTPDRDALRLRRIGSGYLKLLQNIDFVRHCVILGGAMGLIFVFITGAPFVLIEQLGIGAEHYGFYQSTIVIAFFLGSMAASRLVERIPANQLLHFGILLQIFGVVALAFVTLAQLQTPAAVTAPFALMTFGLGSVFTVAPSRALRTISGGAGMASAMLAGIEQGIAGLASLSTSLLPGGIQSMLVVATLMVILIVLCAWRPSSSPRSSSEIG